MATNRKPGAKKPKKATTKNFITVRGGLLPGKIQDIALDGDRTVKTFLLAADIEFEEDSSEPLTIKVNGKDAKLDTVLKNNDVVFLARDIGGN